MYKVAVLMSTYNGEKYLYQQLHSIKNQKGVKTDIYVIDDGSRDKTIKILKEFSSNIKIFDTKKFKNPTLNFLYLINNVPLDYDYYCFSDQDDVWLKNKLNYSIKKLKKYNGHVLGSRTLYTDKNLKIFGRSPLFKKKICFENSLVQSITGGNTNIWTREFNEILSKLKYKIPASHDWYIYQVCTYLGYKFIYSKRPLILYRQHEKNLIGSNTGIVNLIKRIVMGLRGRAKEHHEMNLFHLHELKKENKDNYKTNEILTTFYEARLLKNPFKRTYIIIFKLKIFRQTILGNLMLFLAIFLNKV